MRKPNRIGVDVRETKTEYEVHHLFYEGVVTEHQYFSYLIKNNDWILKRERISVKLLNRYGSEVGLSNPNTMLSRINDLINSKKINKELVLDNISKFIESHSTNLSNAQEVNKAKQKTIEEINELLKGMDISEIVSNANILATKIKQIIDKNLFPIDDVNEIIKLVKTSQRFADGDKIHLVCDIDKHFNSQEKYNKFIEKCKHEKVNVYITKPCFELWILFHHSDCKCYDYNNLLNNTKIGNNGKFISWKLRDFHAMSKKHINDEKFYSNLVNVQKAIDNSLNYSTNLFELYDKLGTNIPDLLIMIFKKNLHK